MPSGLPRKKPGPKPKIRDPNAVEEKKTTRKPRKTAEPKEQNAAPVPRKRRTKASLEAQAQVQIQPQTHTQIQPQPPPPPPPPPAAAAPPSQEKPLTQQTVPQQTRPTEPPALLQPEQPNTVTQQSPRLLNNSPQLHSNPNLSHVTAAPSTPRPTSSGQRYDPIRGGVFETKPPAAATVSPPASSALLNRASASPSITSLIDPPSASNSVYPQPARQQQHSSVTSAPASPAALSMRSVSLLPHQEQQPKQAQPPLLLPTQPQQHQQPSTHPAPPPLPQSALLGPTPMEIDSDVNPRASVPMKKSDSTSGATPSASNAPTPPVKAVRQKDAPPPLPMGSGLLSGTPLGPAVGGNGPSEQPQGVNIWLSFPIKNREYFTINFAQEVEKKYGFAALHPRIAARKERQRQITAAGAALEKAHGMGSADDMSVDLSENESNNDVTGMDDDGSGAGNGTKKRRKRKTEDYDKEDDFIDDAELAWEQQALMVRDGFFVYSGPLVTEEKVTIERYVTRNCCSAASTYMYSRADGTTKRGRGRGRGGATRGETSGRGRGRGGGPGSRGGTTVRKPRVTKADRALMEQEKHEREKLAQGMLMQKSSTPAYAGAGGV
ncbi:histone promoter control 2 [Periconia macrospinosa]|uniref:Histone promoter control 2 n=1 Tax=Periconia macrospinosa TaxID=97972 RepID=A0A2V1EE74_9PLEO|nr:histone promoter control 2 [Periconia macrospinosa]